MKTFQIALVALIWATGSSMAADPIVPSPAGPPAPVEQSGIWAAIAYSETDQRHGFFWGADRREEAERTALQHCQNASGENCRVVTVFRNHRHWDDDDGTGFPYNSCGALAVGEHAEGPMTPWAANSASTRREAESAARAACEANGGTCNIREWVCT